MTSTASLVQYEQAAGPLAASLRPDLCTAFARALPAPGWASMAHARILVAWCEPAAWQPWQADARDLLDPAERARVERRHFAADRDALTLAYALHRLLLGQALGCDASRVPLTRDARGCPRLADRSLSTSLSHAPGCIALALSADGAVGIDIEPAARAASMPEIAERVCHPVDAALLAGLVPPAWNAALLALWVRKEAFLKAAGVGLAREMHGFAAPADGLLPLSPGAADMTRLHMLDAGADWFAAVAAPPGVAVASAWLRPGARQTAA